MLNRRTVASIAGLVLLAGTLSISGAASATSAPRAVSPKQQQPAIGVRAAGFGPSRNYAVPPGSYFSFPNTNKADKVAIRNRVLLTIQGVWGGPRDRYGLPATSDNGSIRMATWSFNDMTIAKALIAAHNRGASVQIVAAASRNKGDRAWKLLRKKLGGNYYKPGVAGSSDKVSFARQCRGSCRGAGGTPHSKYFLFNNVGNSRIKNITVSTSMNLTKMGFQGQWNEAFVSHSQAIYNSFLGIFRETRAGVKQRAPFRSYTLSPTVATMFFPKPGTTASTDPVMKLLDRTRCTGSTAGGNGRTRIRITQYAIYDARGVWLAKKLRSLWNAGCDIQIIYSISTRPVLSILRNGSGRGAIPMRQSVITNSKREIVKYNHSKWITVAGNWGGSTNSYVTFSGAANWSNAAFANDEQMQQVVGYGMARSHLLNFAKTWSQRSSHAPGYGIKGSEGRLLPPGNSNTIPWGKGAFKYLSPNG
jgi:hypothetical protein